MATTNHKSNTTRAQESSIIDALDIAPEAKFECPICLSWLRDPVVTACGHRFCRNCIESWLQKNNKICPVDNMTLQHSDIFPDNFTRREISQQRTKCPNIKRGCLEELSPLDVEIHLLTCEFKPPEYNLPDNEKLRCSFVDVGCDAKFDDEPCLKRHLEQEIQKHLMLLSSAYRNITLNNQGSSASAIAQQANFWDPPSKSDHQGNKSSAEPIENLLKAMYEKIVVLEQKSREQDIIIANMSDQISANNIALAKVSQRCCNGMFNWYITDFKNKLSQMRNNPQLMFYSPGFYTSYYGYKFCIRFNLSPKDPNCIALLVHMMKTDHDNTLDWPFSGKITIIVVHPTETYRNINETMMTRPELEAFRRPVQDMNPKGFGYTEFAYLEAITTNDFIQSNQLIIKVIINII